MRAPKSKRAVQEFYVTVLALFREVMKRSEGWISDIEPVHQGGFPKSTDHVVVIVAFNTSSTVEGEEDLYAPVVDLRLAYRDVVRMGPGVLMEHILACCRESVGRIRPALKKARGVALRLMVAHEIDPE
jgi:hypothetical protein